MVCVGDDRRNMENSGFLLARILGHTLNYHALVQMSNADAGEHWKR